MRTRRATSSQVAVVAAIAGAVLFAGGIVVAFVAAVQENIGWTLLAMLMWLLAFACGVVWLFAYISSRRAIKLHRMQGFAVIEKPGPGDTNP
jgi:drug/metabolite transporter (DMT)-like permease